MRSKAKIVYRDKASGRLITRHDARSRDPATWTREKIVVMDPNDGATVGRHAEDLLAEVEEEGEAL
jgi:hypothetical protein